MISASLRRSIRTSLVGWCVWGVLLAALQPFIATHFRQDGWEDEPGFHIRSSSATAQFEADDRSDHKNWQETTLFVPASASIDLPDAFLHGLDHLLALVLAALPIMVKLALQRVRALRLPPVRRVPHPSGAPPPAACWLALPPAQAPPPMR